MSYKFLRPCYGPAIYNVKKAETVANELSEKMTTREEVNIAFTMDITQTLSKQGKESRVGRCDITFHCTPKYKIKERAERRKKRSSS